MKFLGKVSKRTLGGFVWGVDRYMGKTQEH
jgi:hypothetical protein